MSSADLKSTILSQHSAMNQMGMFLSIALLSSCSTPAEVVIDQSVQGLYDADLSTDGSTSLIASIHHGASLWSTQDGERRYNWNHIQGQYTPLNAVALAGNGTIGLTAVGRDLVAWNSTDGKPIEFWQLPDTISCLEINELGSHAVVGMSSGQAMLIDIHNNGFIWKTKLSNAITACALGIKNKYLALGTQAGQVQLYSIQHKKNTKANAAQNIPILTWTLELKTTLTHPYAINHVNISTEHNLLFSASQHHELWVTDIKSDLNLQEIALKNASISNSILYDDMIILAYTSRRIEFITLSQWTVMQTLTIPKRNKWKAAGVSIASIAYAQNQLTATGSDGVTHIYKNLSP